MTLNATSRKVLSSTLKDAARFEQESAVGTYFATVDCKGSGDVEPIGTLMKYNSTNSAFYPYTVAADWEASTTYAVGAVVKPTTVNGLEYICVVAGDSDATEHAWNLIPGVTEAETAGVEWLGRFPDGKDVLSPLPDGSTICITVGQKEGIGFNKEDVTLSSSAVKMTVLFRGEASVVGGGIIYGTAVEAEVNRTLEMNGIVVATAATDVVPSLI